MSAPQPRPEVFSVASYVGGESVLPGFEKPIKLSSNEGAFGPPPSALAALAATGEKLHRYPDGSSAKLRAAIGEKFGLDPAKIVCGNGSDELLSLLIQAYGGPGTELIMSVHGFSIYEIAGKLAGCTVLKAAEQNLTTDVGAMLALVTPQTKMLFLANPNNPTGTLLPQSEMLRLRAGLPEDVLLVIDAAYSEYVDRPDYDPGIALVDAGENTVMTRTFSKIFGLGGARLGWAYAPLPVIDVLNRMRAPFNVSVTAAAAGIAALAEPGWLEAGRAHNTQARTRLEARLAQLGLEIHPSEANFTLVDFGSPARAAAADQFLRARGLIVRNVKSYGLPSCLRITIGTDDECNLVAATLNAFVHG
ncbi:histidinol-phosphate transaminase [Acidocella sp.]|uniref:histidinol-phosphate transaminase n=1 Tax=Acidocella sp. TaxID=50710 RepID=UPI00261B0F63|nr:histidinol-phosphate transaminase [Acidocella sp.]MDD2794944.1 histidinol-phosphate transaminase [Acidocella sp.]